MERVNLAPRPTLGWPLEVTVECYAEFLVKHAVRTISEWCGIAQSQANPISNVEDKSNLGIQVIKV